MEKTKKEAYVTQHVGPVEVSSDEASIATALSPQQRAAAERALVRRLDMRLLPVIVLIYLMNYVDRIAITSARLKGMEEDLGLSDLKYDAVIAIMYVSYAPMQVPSNMLLNKVPRPSVFIGTCVVSWGLISALTGSTRNYAGIMVCRVLLGFPERLTSPLAAFYPGAMYLLSRWYTRKQLALRCAILYLGLTFSNGFGSLLAAGILGNMDGKRGIRAWRWLFYIEGVVTILVGFLSMWVLPDYPHNTRWLDDAETSLAQARLAEEVGESDRDGANDSAWLGFKMAILDTKVQIFMIIGFSYCLGLGFVNFFPTLVATLGFPTTPTLLLAAPPWIFAALVCLGDALHADHTGGRFFHIGGPWCGAMLGYIISLCTMSVGGRYVSLFLMAAGNAGVPLLMVWVSNTIPRPPAKRAAAMAMLNATANLGTLIASFTWKAEWGPKYHQSIVISLGVLVFSTVLLLVMRQILVRENAKLDAQEAVGLEGSQRERVEEYARLKGITFEEALCRKKGFRYLY